jgi:hypothetical protein
LLHVEKLQRYLLTIDRFETWRIFALHVSSLRTTEPFSTKLSDYFTDSRQALSLTPMNKQPLTHS